MKRLYTKHSTRDKDLKKLAAEFLTSCPLTDSQQKYLSSILKRAHKLGKAEEKRTIPKLARGIW